MIRVLNNFYQYALRENEAFLLSSMRALSAVAIIMYLMPYLIFGNNGHWMIWDNLDSNFVAYQVLLDSSALFAPNAIIIEQPLGGLPRGTLASEFDAFVWLYMIFGAEGAYIFNRVAMTLIGFIGMYFLLGRHVVKGHSDEIVRVGVSLCFSLLPFWPFGGLSVSGMPLALFAMLEIRRSRLGWWNWAIVILYPFYSHLILAGFFFLCFVSAIWISDAIRRRMSHLFLLSIIIMSMLYVLTNYRLFMVFIGDSMFISHRIEFISSHPSAWLPGLKRALSVFSFGHQHAISLQQYIILPLLFVGALLMLRRSLADRSKTLFWLIVICLGVFSLFHGLQNVAPISTALTPIKAILPMQFDRFYFLSPMLWMLGFAIVLSTLRRHASILKLSIVPIIVLQVACSFWNHELIRNRNGPSVSEFFAYPQFSLIKDYIDQPVKSYRVASVGIHPSVALYNGFYTLDGYWANYPLSYKHAFREIISGELEKNNNLRSYFDNWGSRVYLFNAQTGGNMVLRAGTQVEPLVLDYDWNAFYRLGGRYVLSAVEIDISNNPELNFERKFEDLSSAWDIYLYRVSLLGEQHSTLSPAYSPKSDRRGCVRLKVL